MRRGEDETGAARHHKNAAEWVMFVVVYPFAWLVARFSRSN